MGKVHHEALHVLDAHARTHARTHTHTHTHARTQPVTTASTMGFSSASCMTSVCAFSSAFIAVEAMLPSPDAVFSALRLMFVRGVSKKNSLGAGLRRQRGCIHIYQHPRCIHIYIHQQTSKHTYITWPATWRRQRPRPLPPSQQQGCCRTQCLPRSSKARNPQR